MLSTEFALSLKAWDIIVPIRGTTNHYPTPKACNVFILPLQDILFPGS